MRRIATVLGPGLVLMCGMCLAAQQPAQKPAQQPAVRTAPPVYRVEPEGFNASERDIKALLDSAACTMWRYFPTAKIEPLVITRGHEGPITLFRRNDRGEIVMRLDTGNTYWSQYVYQFGHEFCHILCGFRADSPGNKWFEETLCETASLFVLRAMARSWQNDPPYPNWKDYRDSLRQYADDVACQRDQLDVIAEKGLGAFYRANREAFRKEPCLRELNGAMAVVLLRLLEKEPEHWEAVRGLNSGPSTPDEPLALYFRRWHNAMPVKHKPFVKHIARLYGIALEQP